MTKIYTVLISLNSVFAQLLDENNMQYFSIFLFSIGTILMLCNFHKIKFSKQENIYIFSLMWAVLINVFISPDNFLSFRCGIRLLFPFLIFILFTILMKNHNSFRFYLRTNVYVSIIFVIIMNYFYIVFSNQPSIEDPYRGMERTVGFFTGDAGWHGLAHYSLLTIFLISFYKPITSSRIEKY